MKAVIPARLEPARNRNVGEFKSVSRKSFCCKLKNVSNMQENVAGKQMKLAGKQKKLVDKPKKLRDRLQNPAGEQSNLNKKKTRWPPWLPPP